MDPQTGLCIVTIVIILGALGVFWFILVLFGCFIAFLTGALALLYLQHGNIENFIKKCSINNPLTSKQPQRELKTAIRALLWDSDKGASKFDSRVTGSELIDSSLQEILGYIIRDYVESWYSLISPDKEFTRVTVRQLLQMVLINLSNRIKEVDWVPYLTQQIVDDAATHLRLYKQARAKLNVQKRKDSPSRSSKLSHKRNKSETDVTWYVGKGIEVDKNKWPTLDNKKLTIEEHFFNLELQMEQNQVCRKAVCTTEATEREFLSELVEVLLYILLPNEDFQCKPLRFLLRDIFCNGVLLPLFNLITEPDYINQMVLWICLRNNQISSEAFLITLRLSESKEELLSTKESVENEMHNLRSRDSGGEDLTIKQQLNSLAYVIKLLDSRLLKMENDAPDFPENFEKINKIDLTLDQILKDNLGLSYFMDFVSSQGKQLDLFLYLNIEGWKDSVAKELAQLNSKTASHENAFITYDMARSTALGIFDQYLGGKRDDKVQISDSLIENLHFKIRNLNETPHEAWFDKVKEALFIKMEKECLAAFKNSKTYVKLLHELDLLPQSTGSIIEEEESFDSLLVPKPVKHVRSFSDVTMFKNGSIDVAVYNNNSNSNASQNSDGEEVLKKTKEENEESLKTGDYGLAMNIIETGIVCEKGKTFGIYAIKVNRQYSTGYTEEWHIYRRYSDFHDLHTKVKEKYSDLSKLTFPGKKTFHNMDRAVLERRMKMLGQYMGVLCQMIDSHSGLRELLNGFLEQGDYDRAAGGPISATINTLVNPIKSGMKSIKNVPEQLINTMDEMVGGLSKVFQGKSGEKLPETSKVGASIEETDDNIPLRIMLLLMDEVFDLKCRNQWLRRRIVTILRQILRTMFGDIVNRRILDFVSYLTSPKNVAYYLHYFKQSFWPHGVKSDKQPPSERSPQTKNRTRIATKAALLSCLSDELKRIIGSETTRKGLLTVFDLLQNPVLNRRLLYLLLEGALCALFPEKDLTSLFHKLHSSDTWS